MNRKESDSVAEKPNSAEDALLKFLCDNKIWKREVRNVKSIADFYDLLRKYVYPLNKNRKDGWSKSISCNKTQYEIERIPVSVESPLPELIIKNDYFLIKITPNFFSIVINKNDNSTTFSSLDGDNFKLDGLFECIKIFFILFRHPPTPTCFYTEDFQPGEKS